MVYWVSKEFPYWYTADRRPDYAFISEGQEHRIHVDAQRVIFAGGDFMFCLLRNAQMTLHGMLNQNARRIDLVFPPRLSGQPISGARTTSDHIQRRWFC